MFVSSTTGREWLNPLLVIHSVGKKQDVVDMWQVKMNFSRYVEVGCLRTSGTSTNGSQLLDYQSQ